MKDYSSKKKSDKELSDQNFLKILVVTLKIIQSLK